MQKNNHQPGQAAKARRDLGVGNDTIMIPYKPNPLVIPNGINEAISQTILTPEHCEEIIAKHSPEDWPEGTISGTGKKKGVVENSIRATKSVFLRITDDPALFDLLLAIVLKGNEHFQFDIDFFEAVQLSKYEVDDFYDWHVDIGTEHAGNRKLSVTVQLSAPDSYEGGDLEMGCLMLPDGTFFKANREIGSVTLFPSFMRHRVTPVTKGTRYSLVAWASGERRFR